MRIASPANGSITVSFDGSAQSLICDSALRPASSGRVSEVMTDRLRTHPAAQRLQFPFSFKERALDLMTEGLQAFREYLAESGVRKTKIAVFEKMAETFYADAATLGREKPLRRGVEWTELRKAIQTAEKAAIKHAVERVAELEEEHKVNTRSWVRATDAMKVTIQADINAIEEELAILKPRTVPLGDRLRQLREEFSQRHDQVDKLEKEWPQLEASAKGEAMQRLFSSVTLYWDSKFNPSPERPTRVKKTDREGRWSHTLNEEKIEWGLTPELGGTIDPRAANAPDLDS